MEFSEIVIMLIVENKVLFLLLVWGIFIVYLVIYF